MSIFVAFAIQNRIDYNDLEFKPTKYYTTNNEPRPVTSLAIISLPPNAETQQIIYGDLDKNGSVDLSDLTFLSQYILKDIMIEAAQLKCADVNADEEVNLQDLALLKQYVMHDEVKLGTAAK